MATNFNWFGDRVLKEIAAGIESGLDRLCEEIAETARQSMVNTTHKGADNRATFKRGRKAGQRKGRDKRPSADYHPPAVQVGTLKNSVQWAKLGPRRRRVGSALPYALYLELGTRKMQPRPWLRPAIMYHTGRDASEVFEQIIRK